MRTVPLGLAALAAAALFGLAPPRSLAADPAPGPSTQAPHGSAAAQSAAVKSDPSQRGASSAMHAEVRRSRAASEPTGRRLDLSAPPLNHVMTPEQVQALTAQPSEEEPEQVMVERGRYEAPVPRGQLRALAWALMHPLEAWRIFTPVTDQ